VGPRIQAVTLRDSLTAVISFTQVLDPAPRPDAATVVQVLALPDSTPVPVATLLFRAAHDSLYAAQDTTKLERARPDTAALRPAPPLVPRQVPPREAGRPRPAPAAAAVADTVGGFRRDPLPREMVLRMAQPLAEKRNYLVRVTGIRNANGVAGEATAGLEVPERPKAPTDTLPKARPDSLPAVKRDTAPAAPPPGVRP
jgi:hypothetical protein